jgi:hypothetical protein
MTTLGQRNRDGTHPRDVLDLRKSPRIDAETVAEERAAIVETAANVRRRGTSEALARFLQRSEAR